MKRRWALRGHQERNNPVKGESLEWPIFAASPILFILGKLG
jgi:hypothetical protein